MAAVAAVANDGGCASEGVDVVAGGRRRSPYARNPSDLLEQAQIGAGAPEPARRLPRTSTSTAPDPRCSSAPLASRNARGGCQRSYTIRASPLGQVGGSHSLSIHPPDKITELDLDKVMEDESEAHQTGDAHRPM